MITATPPRWIILICAFHSFGIAKEEPAQRPNVLFLFTDDQRADTINSLGNQEIQTPVVDRLVRSGLAFENAYIMGASSPAVCSPSRAMLFSGRTLWNIETQGIWEFEISPAFKTLPQVFRENGYITFATGKNTPGKKGHFARSFTTGDKLLFHSMTNSQYNLPLCPFSPEGNYERSQEVIHKGTHSSTLYADACIDFLKTHKDTDKPFFAYVSFQTPHDPRQSPQEFQAMYKAQEMTLPESFMPQHPFDNGMLKIRDEKLAGFPRKPQEIKKHLAAYYSMISHTDAEIGRILKVLETTGKAKNTIIVYSSDNGLGIGSHGLMGKQNLYEHALKVPLIIVGPGIAQGEIRPQLCYIYDIYPTLCDLAGLPIPNSVQFSSLVPVIKSQEAKHRQHLYYAFMQWQRSIRKDQYKLIEYSVKGNRHTQLFDVESDPQELKNLASSIQHQEILAQLRALLEKERIKLHDGNTPYSFTDKQGKTFWHTYHNSRTQKAEPSQQAKKAP